MSERTTTIVSNYLFIACAVIAVLVVIPAAAAAANRMRPVWRAWVWPVAFAALTTGGILRGLALADGSETGWSSGSDISSGFGFNLIVVGACYRAVEQDLARKLALLAWTGFIAFILFSFQVNSFAVLTSYTLLCLVVLYVLYVSVYMREKDRAADVWPILIGLSIMTVGTLIYNLIFSVNLVLFVPGHVSLYQLLAAVGILFVMSGANASYGVRYAAQRNSSRRAEI